MTVSNIYSVAVDGPSGAGKSTLSKEVAKELGIVYVDTGAIYRTIGYYIFTQGIDPKDERAVTAVLPEVQVDMRYGADGLQRMFLGGTDVTEKIRLPEISMYARRCRLSRLCGLSCWRCSGTWPGAAALSWMAGTSAPWCCRRPR